MSDEIAQDAAADATPAHFFELFNEIGIINQLATTEFSRVLPHGLTNAQFSILNHCVRLGDNKTPARLAAAFQITRGTLTSTLQRLEAKGFIELVPDAHDGRSKRVLLTESGRQARADAVEAAVTGLAHMQAALRPKDLATLLPILKALRLWLDNNRSGS